jgi:hypothetical protein
LDQNRANDYEELDIYLDPKFNTEFDPNITEIDQTVLTINEPAVSAVPMPVNLRKDDK